MKIYTKTGDEGETGLLGGVRISKSHTVIQVTGALDETNSMVGLTRSESLPVDVDDVLKRVQNELFDLGSRVAASLSDSRRAAHFSDEQITNLESEIDRFDEELDPLEAFVLPGGNRAASLLHVARSVCRRAESGLVGLIQQQIKQPLEKELIYLNRLSDLLFVLARLVNHRAGTIETKWEVGKKEG